MNYLKLGKVAFQDTGSYDSERTYERYQFVTTEDSCYLSRKDGNKGHAVTDTEWWSCLANGRTATDAALKATAAATKANDTTSDITKTATEAEESRAAAETVRVTNEAARQAAAAIGRFSIDYGTDAETATAFNMETCSIKITDVQRINCDALTLNEAEPVGTVIAAGNPMIWNITRQTAGLEAAIGVTYIRINNGD